MSNFTASLEILKNLAAIVGLPTLVVLTWWAASIVSRLEAQLDEIRENHLPHIYEELKELRQDITNLNASRSR